ncbi:MAG: tetratricopeptide repeat protein [Anaerolineae bacterium]|nr:tetratricopeptide repeat protein [Anaerolineae bacterium]MCB9108055.1 tetratricopeptide repeat protein [Anaerolineales bacterium]
MPHLALFLFGPPRIELDGRPVKINRHKATALLTYLVVSGKTHSRNTLAALLWPETDQRRARSALRRVLVTLHRAELGPWLEVERETIGLNQDAPLWSDVTQFRRCLGQCLAAQHEADTVCLPLLAEAVSLYNTDFMSGFSLRDSPNFDDWQLFQTESLRHDLSSALARLVRYHGGLGEFERAIAYAQRWLKVDPLYEAAHRHLMQLYTWSNQRTAALRQYEACRQILKEELGVQPSIETQTLYQRIHQNQENPIEPQPQPSPPLTPRRSARLHNFPAQPTPFIGRQQELSEIADRLENPDCRLLTLTGPGGMGKTRLAIQTAVEHSAAFPDGLYFVPLAPISSPDFVVAAIADQLNFSFDGQEDAQPQLINYLRPKKLLLVLDNFEHLIKRAELLADILTEAPGLKILVTSQERLNLHGEWIYDIKGMHFPKDDHVEHIESYSAVALFLQRAHRINSSLTLTEQDKRDIARICRLLEGIPLAIELAAAWVRVLSCREITIEIEQMYTAHKNLDFLATSLRDVPSRHRTLRGVFEHSWQLLSAEEKRAFCRLSVFRGGGQRDAIEWVTEARLMLITTLVDKSLLTRNAFGRYEMHELLRQYAAEKLNDVGQEEQVVQDRHGAYYTTFLRQRETRLKGIDQKEILGEIAREIENIRAAWHWAVTRGKIKEISHALESLGYFYAMYSWFQEGVEAFGRATEAVTDISNPDQKSLLGRILTYLGWFFLRQGLYEQARYLLWQSLELLQELNDRKNLAVALNYLGILAGEVGNSAEANRFLQESLDLYRETHNQWGIAWTLSHLAYHTGSSLHQHDAEALLTESLSIYKAIGNKQGIAVALNNLGYNAYLKRDYATGQKLLQESLTLRREVGFPRGIAVSLNNLGHVYEALGNYQTSQTCYRESLDIATDIRALPLALSALGGIAVCLAHEGNEEQAVDILTLVLHHPASNKETLDRAFQAVHQLAAQLPSGRTIPEFTTPTSAQMENAAARFNTMVAEILGINTNTHHPIPEPSRWPDQN